MDTGITVPKQEYKGTREPILGITKDGYKVPIRIFDIRDGKKPMPFRPGNPYTLENIQTLINQKELKLTMEPNQVYEGYNQYLVAVTEEDYKVMVNVTSLQDNCKLLPFHPLNPFTLENIKTYCKNNRPDYTVKDNQEYKSVSGKLVFKYIGKNIPVGVKDEFTTTWAGFKSGVGHRMVGKGKRVN
jgi:ribosomal protein L21E